MPVGISDGTNYADMGEWVAHTTSGVPLGGSTEPAGALKSSEGSQTPDKAGNDIIATIPVAKRLGLQGADITEADIDKAVNIGLSAGPGTMAGVKAANIRGKLADLGHAQVLEQNGAHPDDIWSQTGFGRGTDGRWRHEIDDSKSSFDRQWVPEGSDKFTTTLSQILDHEELYKAYPHLKDMPVQFDAKKAGASFDGNKIIIGPEFAQDHGVLMHEIQHAIQRHEGFAEGGSPGKSGQNYTLKLAGLANLRIQKPLNELWTKYQSEGTLSEAEFAEMDRLTDLAQKFNNYARAGDEKALENYYRLAGEAEARNTETRLLLKEGERRQIPPSATVDTNPKDQIVVNTPVWTSPYGVVTPGGSAPIPK